jgi:oligopeptide transport system permease protein
MNQTEELLLDSDFSFLPEEEKRREDIVRPSTTFWKDALRRLKMNKPAMAGFIIVVCMIFMAIVMPVLSPYKYDTNYLDNINKGMSQAHLFGTDTLGRDLWTRIWYGGRISLSIGVMGAIFPSLIGIVIGGMAGYFGGIVDMVIMRIIDVLLCIPGLIFVILLMLKLGNGPVAIVTSFALIGWMGSARNVRGLVLQLKNQDYINASRLLGASHSRLIFRHLIPNTLGIVVVGMTQSVPGAIFYEATLSFLGLGVKAPLTSWGQLLQMGVQNFKLYPYQLFIPAVILSVTLLAFNIFGDGVRDALDPRLRS